MEGRNPSSFTDLFGPKDPSIPTSQGILASIFPPPTTSGKKTDSVSTQPWSAQKAVSGEGETKEKTNSYLEEEKPQPFHYSSSIYYGGQDVYSQPTKPAGPPTYNKDVDEDDSGSASRGNWWQGSLYY